MTRFLTMTAVIALLTACTEGRDQPPAPVVYQGSQPAAPAQPTRSGAPATAPAPTTSSSEAAQVVSRPEPAAAPVAAGQTDTRGVTFYDGYQTITARQGDTVDSLARRVGIEGAELAAYNGLSTLYTPLPGDELVLPARPGGYSRIAAAPAPAPAITPAPAQETSAQTASSGSGWSPALVTAAIEGADPQAAPTTTVAPNPVEETAALDTAAAAPSAAATDQTEQPVLQSVVTAQPAPAPAAATPEPAPQQEPAGAVLTTTAPQPTATPAPAAAPQAAETQQVAAASSGFVRPVDAPIARPFSKRAGPDRNDGVDFASPAGSPVKAADSGTVVLVSKSLGGLGTIVLIRHQSEFLTVYGRIDGVTVSKGDQVSRGQVIAQVADLAPPRTPSLHFEIRRGPESVDPELYL